MATSPFSNKIFLQLALLTFVLIISPTLAQKKCRALVLQGGGDKGAYEAGVFKGFVANAKNPQDFQYDVLTGVSVGSINALSIAQFPIGDELEAADFLVTAWNQTRRKDIYINWPGGILQGLFFKPSLFNNNPIINYLKRQVQFLPNKRRTTVVATDINTGKKITFSEADWKESIPMAMDAALFSSSVPFVFQYRLFGNYTLVDGGWSGEGLDVEDAVARCKEIVSDEKDIILDVIFAGNISRTDVKAEKYTALKIFNRYNQINKYVKAVRAFAYATQQFPDVDFRYVMIASHKLPNQDVPLDFSAKNIQYMMNLGIQDALTALNDTSAATVERVLEAAKLYQF